jgi:hypothetical protein
MITTALLENFRKDAQAALAAVYEKHGLTPSGMNFRYNESTFTMKCEIGEKSAIGAVDPTYFKGMDRHGFKHSLKTADIGKTVVIRGKSHELLGMNQTGHFCVGKDLTAGKNFGKLFKLSPEDVRKALGKPAGLASTRHNGLPDFGA